MAKIPTNYLAGAGSNDSQGDLNNPPLGQAIRDIAEDLSAIAGTDSPDVGADLAAFSDPPTAGQMATLRTRVNEILAVLRNNQSTDLKTTLGD